MTNKQKISWRSWNRHGLTLIEVLAALALLAILLAGVLSTKTDAERQWSRADQRLQAIAATDALLTQWMTPSDDDEESSGLPIDESGPLPGSGNLVWQTQLVDHEQAAVLRCQVVRLSILDPLLEVKPVVLTVDLLVPDPNPGGYGDTQAPDEGTDNHSVRPKEKSGS